MDSHTFPPLLLISLNCNKTYRSESASSKNAGLMILSALTTSTTKTFLELQSLLFWLLTFQINVTHTAAQKNTRFCNLFLSSAEPVI